MIDLYTWPTPNGFKASIMLEELGEPYNVIPINIGKGEQFEEDFLKLNPNNKMPVIVDRDGPGGEPYTVIESGAILLYLADKYGRLLPEDTRGRYDAIQWVFFQMANIGPMFGQANHFQNYAPEKIPYAIERYTNERRRLYNVLDRRLDGRTWVAAEQYSIADIAMYPWLRSHARHGIDWADFPSVKRWYDAVEARPAVQKGCQVLAEHQRTQPHTPEEREILFGASQYQLRR